MNVWKHFIVLLINYFYLTHSTVTYYAKPWYPLCFWIKANMTNYISISFRGCGGPERHQMLIVIKANYGYYGKNVYCHISIANAMCLWCSQSISHLNRCKVQSSTTDPGCYSVFTGKVGHYTSWLVSQSSLLFPKVLSHYTDAFGASGAFPSVIPLLHNSPASWLFSSLFSENFSDSGRSNVGSDGARLLLMNVFENSWLWGFCSNWE